MLPRVTRAAETLGSDLRAVGLQPTGSEWRLHREGFRRSALADLLGEDEGLAEIHKLYRCHDRLLEHKQALFDHLVGRWRDLFNVSFDVLLYALSHQVKRCTGSPQFVQITCCCESGELDSLVGSGQGFVSHGCVSRVPPAPGAVRWHAR